MPVRKCSNGKYRIGKGKCMYKSKASAERAYTGYRAHEHIKEWDRDDEDRDSNTRLKPLRRT